MTAEVGSVGPSYKAGVLFHGTEPLYVDLCQACGTVVRLYVKKTERKWMTGQFMRSGKPSDD
ncbi:MAG: hypothetical protein HZA91_06725 [Verrucomicrobia bacterium]|nr:hypothetical protein [Verrucomicrobiota bacterium]